jgi:hypothetical protein
LVQHQGQILRVPVFLNSGQKLEQVNLRVPSAPTISGTVYDVFGERLAAARVQAYRMIYTLYGQRLRAVKSTISDDFGEYRLFWLNPGEYYVAAHYTERDQRSSMTGLRLSPNVTNPDEGLGTIYLGGVFLPAQAQKVFLSAAGDATNVSLSFKETQRFTVKGQLNSPAGPACARVAFVSDGGVLSEDADFITEGCGTYEIRGVTPGNYVLLALGKGIASDLVRISVSNRDVSANVALSQTIEIRGQVSVDFKRTNANLTRTKVELIRSTREVDHRITAPINPDGSFTLENVGPGEYDVVLNPLPPEMFVRSIRVGPRDITFARLYVDSTRLGTLDISLSTAGGSVEGVAVDRSGRPMTGVQIVIVPAASAAARNREDRYKVVTTDAVGNFRASGIAPGAYTAFAFEQIEPGAYFVFAYDPQMYTSYRSRGASVSAEESGKQTVRLIVVPAEETAGGIR